VDNNVRLCRAELDFPLPSFHRSTTTGSRRPPGNRLIRSGAAGLLGTALHSSPALDVHSWWLPTLDPRATAIQRYQRWQQPRQRLGLLPDTLGELEE
jgi:hypothetical protein